MNPLRLEHMTVFDLAPCQVIDLAEQLEIPFISLFLSDGLPGARPVTPADVPDVRNRLRSSPVTLDSAEVVVLSPDRASWQPTLELAAELGARSVVAIHVLPADDAEAAAQLAELAAAAAAFDLKVSLEPISMGQVRTPDHGQRLIRQAGAANIGLTLDLLHIVRTGTPLGTLAAIDPAVICTAQVCDGPATIAPDQAVEEAGYQRGIPGTGVFPVVDFFRVLPPDIVIGMEVPLKSQREAGMSALERTRAVLDATRRLQQLALAGG